LLRGGTYSHRVGRSPYGERKLKESLRINYAKWPKRENTRRKLIFPVQMICTDVGGPMTKMEETEDGVNRKPQGTKIHSNRKGGRKKWVVCKWQKNRGAKH